jgi:pyruvate formate lyase activating enzyme
MLQISHINADDRNSTITGYVHSVETCGTVDGPGIRFIVFTAGCPLRCLYCCNPDCRHLEEGRQMGVDEVMNEIQKYIPYMQASGGGVTICGGEPLYQPQFIQEIFKRCKALNIHTALDTSGFCDLTVAQPVLEFVDLVLLDIKSFDPVTYHKVTGVNIEPTLELARYLNQIHKPVWIRFVLVPELTDDPQNIAELADFLITLTNVVKVDVLPFHKLGEYKWAEMGYEYLLKDTPTPTIEQVNAALNIFKSRNLTAV